MHFDDALLYLHQELLVGQRQNVGDGGGFIVQAEAGQQQQEGGRGRAALVPGALAELARGLAHKLDEVHHEALAHALTAELTLRGDKSTGSVTVREKDSMEISLHFILGISPQYLEVGFVGEGDVLGGEEMH